MNACLVSKCAYTATSSLQELVCRFKAAADTLRKSRIRDEEMQAEYLNSTNSLVRDVDVLEDIADHRQGMLKKCVDFNLLRGSVNAWSHLSFRWATEKNVKKMAAVIEK
jgi:hypothetical protein